jgi:hypothetical protein
MFTHIITNKLTRNLCCSTMILSVGFLTACSDTEKETKKSTDFATVAIQANYSVEVSEAHKVIYRANFSNGNDSLKLENGDVVSISASSSESIALTETVSAGIATYSLARTETSDPARPFFDFTRITQEDANNSFVIVPNGFVLASPTLGTPNYSPSDKKTFTVTWLETSSSVPVPDLNEEFKLRYDFTCRHSSGTPSIQSSVVEAPEDNGSHIVDLVKVLGTGDYAFCSQFDIIAIRSNAKTGSLARPIIDGSVVGSQVRTIKGSLSGLQLP